ncbi:MAG: hypothetical protein ACLURV_13290 [Gallintestinimicrobium sp.]
MTIPLGYFPEIYENEYQEKFKELGIEYFTLDRRRGSARHESKGWLHLGMQNHDGDVMSDMVSLPLVLLQ